MQQLERWFTANGYTVSSRTTGQLQFVAAQGPHRLVVSVDPVRTVFVFAPAAPRVELPDGRELERRIDSALGGTVGPAPAPRVAGQGTRCSICATVIPAGAAECPMCGMTV